MKWWKKILLALLTVLVVFAFLIFWLSQKPVPERIVYGMSFNTPYATELGLNWRTVYDAILDDLGVRKLRLAAHWDLVEAERDQYNFVELDYQLERAEDVGAEVIFGVGRRLPRWPECHNPAWALASSEETQQAEILEYITEVVNRYKDSPAIIYWQVENEPFLRLFGREHCPPLDQEFLKQEIALVKELDPTRPVLLTDSGNLGLWAGAYRKGDAFGTSVYVHFWNQELGQFRTHLPPWFYRFKEGVMKLLYGSKPTYLIELSAEPWLVEPIVEVDIETQFSRMNTEKFEDILEYAKATRFQYQYLWGAEWWYWLKLQGHPEFWERGRELFKP